MRYPLLLLVAAGTAFAQQTWIPDPAGDTKAGPDLVAVQAIASNGILTLRARFAAADFDPKLARLVWVFDTDHNSATGSPGLVGAPGTLNSPTPIDAAFIGAENVATMFGACNSGSFLAWAANAKKWNLAGLVTTTIQSGGFDAWLALPSAAGIRYKVLSYPFSGICPPPSISFTGSDVVPDIGQPAAAVATASSTVPAPRPLAPAEGAAFDTFPRKLKMEWSPSLGAIGYIVQVQYQDPTAADGWKPQKFHYTAGTTAETDFVGAQPGRWKVWAIDGDAVAGRPTDWINFTFTK